MRRCDGIDRREFLRIGSLSALGLGLADALRAAPRAGKLRNCILVWLDGGPSHLDTFDLKPDAPEEVRGPFRPIPTAVPGMQISEYFRRLASQTDKVCLIRSMTSELGEHNLGSQYLLTGYKPSPALDYPSIGAVATHLRKGDSPLPPFVAVPRFPSQGGSGNGYLPAATRAFSVGGDPGRPEFRVRDLDMPAGLDPDRLNRRREFLDALDGFHRAAEGGAVPRDRDAAVEQAYRLVLSPGVKQAFDLTRESAPIRERYGRGQVGQSCLLARRLVEAGCPFVTVTNPGWDTHQQIYRELKEGFVGGSAGRIPQLDQALAALLGDLHDRGLLADTLVLVMGEFGRTPKLNTNAGRDHWPRAFSVLLAGGGTAGGRVVGASDSRGEVPADRPVTPADLARTVYTLLGIDPDLELHTPDGRPVRVAAGKLVQECVA